MTTLLFYQNPVPLSRETHRDFRLQPAAEGFSYAATSLTIPLADSEFVFACHEYPIVFIVDEQNQGVPVALTGLRADENLFVSVDNQWIGAYLPGFVRRYPFVVQEHDDNNYTVLIDEAYVGFGKENGERLFNDDGSETPLLSQALAFVQEYKGQTERTKLFMTRLQQHDLLVPRGIDFTERDKATASLGGFSVVDETRLMALGDAALLELARSGDLGRIYAHLLSLGNLHKLTARLEERMAQVKVA